MATPFLNVIKIMRGLGVYPCRILDALLIKLVEVVVARPQNEVVERMQRLERIEGFVLNDGVVQFRVLMVVPFADTQPVLTVTEGVHPLVQNTPVEQVVDGQVHVAEVRAAPEAQAIVTVKATEQVAESGTVLGEFQLADEVLLIPPCFGGEYQFDDEMFRCEAHFNDRMAVGVYFFADADGFFTHQAFDHFGLFLRTEVGQCDRVTLIE